MVANNATYNGKYRSSYTRVKLARFVMFRVEGATLTTAKTLLSNAQAVIL